MNSKVERADLPRLRLIGVDWVDPAPASPAAGRAENTVPASGPFVGLPSLFGDLVGGLSALTVNLDEVGLFLNGEVTEAINARQIPQASLKPPSADVLFPAVEALRYSGSRSEIARLIASAMDERVAHSILPSYVEVLKQLSADEFELLRRTPILGRYAPACDLLYVFPRGQVAIGYRHILPDFLAKACTVRSNIPQYIDNLMRLSLIDRPAGERADDYLYLGLTKFEFVQTLKKASPARARPAIEKSVVGITDFGDQFRRACLG
jgi:hypothetical protein